METFVATLLTLSTAVWVGAIVFQSAVVAPAVFVELDEAAARSFLRTLFPRFFRLGLICGVLMLAAVLGFAAFSGWTAPVAILALITFIMIILEATSLAMVPHINSARDAGATGHAKFERLHRTSVLLTVAILLLGISVLVIVAANAARGM